MMPLQSFNFRDENKRKQTVEVLFEDEQLLVVNKPAGIPVIPYHWNPDLPNLKDMLQAQYVKQLRKHRQEILTTHRIDSDSSGVVIFARTSQMHRELNRLFEQSTIEKIYWAIIEGHPENESGSIDLPLQKHPTRPQFMQVHQQGKPSSTHYDVVESFKHFSLLKVMPKTGRTHQIRVHLREINCPLAIDPVYGYRESFDLSVIKHNYIKKNPFEMNQPLISRLTLHAYQLRFKDPFTNQLKEFTAPLAKDFHALLKALRKWDKH